MANGFEEFEPIFGKANAEWESNSSSSSSSSFDETPFLPFLFHIHALDIYSLRIHVTDFHSYTWEAKRSIEQLQDMRDGIGVGGSWVEFVAYLVESFKSDNVKLVVKTAKSQNSSSDHGATSAKLIAHKSKGMPRISISLEKLMESTASDAMANLSLGLFKAFRSKNNAAVKEEQQQWNHLTTDSSTEQAKSDSTQNHLDAALLLKRQKLQKLSMSDKALPAAKVSNPDPSVSAKLESPKKPFVEKSSGQDIRSTKVGNRAVPAYRRAKTRGAVLEDTEDGQ
ncbi:U2 small nuclear ribonucleoprotein auxiliary factor-like protein [Thalictrum thalictroides]|uniref:U2 small nuclear ribonucleoprotein auxiliary factor-like protein n=1 Tax=Thalictrum thalictroides TaxID=46969 RepID=A0A7J6V0F9_THATH|nr:U2 small nuclear ribonucleoprotein auxiliary factor-like protein [Thalictrum thalictroides]